jgi:glycosyltransferase involved in cell wall biosynthesis
MGDAKQKMKAGIYDPYLDTLGGGERYTMTVAYCLSQSGYQVDVFWDDKSIIPKIKERLGIKVEQINFVPNVFNKAFKIGKKELSNYDLIFFLSDGSIPFLPSKKNILHFQVPFHDVNGRSLLNRIKLQKISAVVCNSNFTKRFIDKEYGVNSLVIYPPVDAKAFKALKKENIILSVGRFTDLLHNKRQDVLINEFKRMIKSNLSEFIKEWKLIIAGGDKEGKEFVAKLKKMAVGYPIEIITNPCFDDLNQWYGRAKIFWTAAGFGINEDKEPERVEHFGITTVEAMAAGCVPVVIRKGGQPEIVKEGINGLLWEKVEELVEKTASLIKEPKILAKLAKETRKRANDFSQARFCQQLMGIIR